MVDCLDKRTRWKDYGAHAYFENTFANTFRRNIPNLAIQFGVPLHDENLDGLGDIISKGQQVLVLDSRPRRRLVRPKLRGKSFVNEIPEGNVGLTSSALLRHALDDFANLHRRLWQQGSSELHIASTVAYFHRTFCECATLKSSKADSEGRDYDFICEAIDKLEELEIAMAVSQDSDSVDSWTPVLPDSDVLPQGPKAEGANVENNRQLGARSSRHLTLDVVISRIITIYQANYVVQEEIKNIYIARKRDVNGPAGERLEPEKIPEIQEFVQKPK